MSVSVWLVAVITVISLMAGFWIGRSMKWMAEETEERVRTDEEEKNLRRIPLGRMIASPVSGTVRPFYEGSRCGALIQPEEAVIYAPVSGRIRKLYPMGQAMLLATDFGMELLLRVGSGGDELCSMYYRSKVVQNEIVGKGKPLLEFDREGLESLGVDVTVVVSLESLPEERNVVVTGKERIKVGEELIWM